MEMHQVRYFLALARTLNFTRAAEECFVTQPALTKSIQKLEQELGGELVHRERKLTQLTDLGKLVLPMLEQTYAAAQSACQHAKEFQQRTIAPLRIGMTGGVSAGLIADPLAEVARAIAGLEIELVDVAADALAERLLGGDLSAALGGAHEYPAADRIDHWRLFGEGYVVLGSAELPWETGEALTADILGKAVWIEHGLGGEQELWSACFASGSGPNVAHRGQNLAQLQELVAAGLGLMLAPEHVPLAHGVTAYRIADCVLRHEVGLLAVAGRRYSAALDAFLKLCRARDWPRYLAASGARRGALPPPTRLPVIRGVPIAAPLDPALIESTHLLDD